eukprot:s2819_g11.t1
MVGGVGTSVMGRGCAAAEGSVFLRPKLLRLARIRVFGHRLGKEFEFQSRSITQKSPSRASVNGRQGTMAQRLRCAIAFRGSVAGRNAVCDVGFGQQHGVLALGLSGTGAKCTRRMEIVPGCGFRHTAPWFHSCIVGAFGLDGARRSVVVERSEVRRGGKDVAGPATSFPPLSVALRTRPTKETLDGECVGCCTVKLALFEEDVHWGRGWGDNVLSGAEAITMDCRAMVLRLEHYSDLQVAELEILVALGLRPVQGEEEGFFCSYCRNNRRKEESFDNLYQIRNHFEHNHDLPEHARTPVLDLDEMNAAMADFEEAGRKGKEAQEHP